jgi:hypothetical protein
MAKMKLKQLRDADVRYISLVDRAATRIPFRVLKRDKESKMGIDLTGVFKSDDTAKPYVSALVVFAQKDEAAAKEVAEAIKTHGFKTDRVQKSDEGETLVYAQTDQPKDTQVIRLSEQTLISVANLKTPNGWLGDMVEEHGFFPDLKTATAALFDRVAEVSKSDTPQADAQAVLTSYAEYLNQMLVLPTAAYALDEAIAEIVKKCACVDEKDEKKEAVTKESEEERKKRIKDHPPSEMAPVDEEDDQKPPPDAVEKADKKPEVKDVKKKDEPKKDEAKKDEPVKKADPKPDDAILTALKGIESTVKGLAEKLDTVVAEQGEQKKVLDGVVQKADTLSTTLKATVTAVPAAEDRPASTRMRVQKDDDPRTGNFDTAFLRRRK